jgi:hypothetical protein
MANNNVWIQMNGRRIEAIKRQLIEYSYAGSYGGTIPLMEVNSILEGALLEIAKLQRSIDSLNNEVKTLQKQQETVEVKLPDEITDAG